MRQLFTTCIDILVKLLVSLPSVFWLRKMPSKGSFFLNEAIHAYVSVQKAKYRFAHIKKKQPCYFSVMSLSRAHLKWMNKYMYDNDQFKVNSQEKNHIYEVLVFVLLQVQGVVWCKPCGNFCRVSTVVLLLVNRTFMKKITSKCK